ncbi:hypothetical protein HHK36_001468 [Tetracentron sinense]|uniref:OBG-type G domain-containing protein n=1 Tax=Tetracentron sinense TaxID=13715 RepID=A0A835A2T4_TETSI|nr:hypothetical protein HHK36_001468 [Tetracentron sinense]
MAKVACHHLIPALGFPLKSSLFRNHSLQWRNLTENAHSISIPDFRRRFSSSSKISMSLKAGIVGLPNVGKSTLFNAVVENGKAQAANFPFCTIEPNVGIVAVPDPRLHVLSDLSKSQRAVPASIEFVDIAGLVKGASQGEGLGNKFLSHIREVDSILQISVDRKSVLMVVNFPIQLTLKAYFHDNYLMFQVVRCFEDNDIVHVSGKIDPKSDIDVINLELVFSDLDQIEKRLEKLKKGKAKDSPSKQKEEAEKSALEKIQKALMDGKPARSVILTDFEKESIKHLCLLTMKPIIYVANVAESDLAEPGNNPHVEEVVKLASDLQSGLVTISAQVESELTELPSEERTEFLKSLGVSESGLGNLIRATYGLLGLRTYFTSGEKETKAWTILTGTELEKTEFDLNFLNSYHNFFDDLGMTAPQAAGVIHSDFEKGFIRAETVRITDIAITLLSIGQKIILVAYDDFVAVGSLAAAREKGLVRPKNFLAFQSFEVEAGLEGFDSENGPMDKHYKNGTDMIDELFGLINSIGWSRASL